LGYEGGIKATTGFQSQGYSVEEMVSIFNNVLASKEKEFEFTQSRVRSAKDVFSLGGHVTIINRDQKIRMLYDNRRIIEETKGYKGFDMSVNLFDSKPFTTPLECSRQRFISRFAFKLPYLKAAPVKANYKSIYKSYLEVGVRSFLKRYLAEKPFFGLKGNEFKGYKELISFITGYDQTNGIKISKQSISALKHRKLILRPVPNTRENIAFAAYLKTVLPHFDDASFLKK